MSNKNKAGVKIEEDMRIFIHRQIDLFLQDDHQTELDFPSSLTNQHRAYIHEYVKNKRLKSKSHGKGNGRYLSIYKMSIAAITHEDAILHMTAESTKILLNVLEMYNIDGTREVTSRRQNVSQSYSIYLAAVSPTIPPSLNGSNNVLAERQRLPIAQFHKIILKCIQQNQVLIISGSTGSGKTTQVPQFIMEEAAQKNSPCRIICTQPRRISAVTVAERVCCERNEQLGDTVGYQIRLESRLKRTTNLVFCTNGILLRCLMGKCVSKFLKNVTHIIVDEVHERDQYSDFLLIALKDNLSLHPHVKVILMSATIESNTFSNYFNNCPVIEIPGRLFTIQNYYLEDILFNISTYNNSVNDVKRKIISNMEHQNGSTHNPSIANMDDETILLMNDILEVCWIENCPEAFSSFYALVEEEISPIDFQHTETKMTALMIAAAKGYTEIVKKLLNMGANVLMKEKHNYTAYDWARFVHGNSVCSELLRTALSQSEPPFSQVLSSSNAKLLLDAYHTSVGDEKIDHNLIIDIILYICHTQADGGILVFLPGYEDIQEQFDLLHNRISSSKRLQVYMLHSKMQTIDQHSVFKPVPQGMRKVILATNIAETSITMDDVVYVVDSGKVKQKYYDSLTSTSSLAATWISQACATQRAGRAGRTKPGKCFRLFSRNRLDALDQFTLPEIIRVPLNEICLQTALITKDVSIHEFLNKAIQAPSATSIKQSIRYLQKVGALDDDENVTSLGHILAELPVDARLGKMLLYGILLKCFEPVLLIVSILSINDIFMIPSFPGDKEKAKKIRRNLAEESYSDCFCFLRAYQQWSEIRSTSKQRELCNRLFLSHSKLIMVHDLRNKLYAHLCSIGVVKRYGPGGLEDINEFSHNWSIVKGCLLVGLYPNVCFLEKYSKTMKTRFEKKIFIHPSSVVAEKTVDRIKNGNNTLWLPSEWIAFEEKYKSGRGSMIRCNTVMSAMSIAIFAGPLHLEESECLIECEQTESMKCKIAIDDWINLTVEANFAKALLHIRRLVNELFITFIDNPRIHTLSARDFAILKCLGEVLSQEDQALGLSNSLEELCVSRRTSKNPDFRGDREELKRNVHRCARRK